MNRRSLLAALCAALRKAFLYEGCGRTAEFIAAHKVDISDAHIRNLVVGESNITRHICIALRGY